jgi:hypothetical protein
LTNPDGYDDSNIISFRNAKNELIEAVEVRTEDTIYLVKVSTKLADRIENYDEDDEIIDDVVEPIKGLDLDDIDDDDDEDNDKPDSDLGDDDDDESDEKDYSDDDEDED